MATAPRASNSRLLPNGGVSLPASAIPPPTPERIAAKIDLAISLSLSAWPAMTLAIQNSWGGPLSADKRDWLAGAISSLFTENPSTDVEDLEEVLLQVMNDEFEVVLDDGSPFEVAAKIVGLRKDCLTGDFAAVDREWEKWSERQKKPGSNQVQFQRGTDEEGVEGEWEDDDEDDEDDEDEDMEDAPPLVERKPKEKVIPEIDEEGFTKVTGKKR